MNNETDGIALTLDGIREGHTVPIRWVNCLRYILCVSAISLFCQPYVCHVPTLRLSYVRFMFVMCPQCVCIETCKCPRCVYNRPQCPALSPYIPFPISTHSSRYGHPVSTSSQQRVHHTPPLPPLSSPAMCPPARPGLFRLSCALHACCVRPLGVAPLNTGVIPTAPVMA